MRKTLSLALAALAVAAAAYAAASKMTVSVDQAKVRKSKQFFAPAVATVKLGDAVEATGAAEDGWFPVKAGGKRGWLHASAVAAGAARVKSGDWKGDGQADAEEVTLAGKGFNDDVERSYRKKNPGVDYAGVDAMQERTIPEAKLLNFMKLGGTLPREAR